MPISDHSILLQPQRWPSLCVVWITVAAGTSGSTCMQSFKTDCAVFADLTSSSTLDPLTNGKELVLIMPATEHVGSHGLTPCQIHLPAMSQLAEHSKEAKLNCAIVTVLDREEGTLRQYSMTWPHLSILIICSDSIGSDLKLDTLPSLTCLLIKASKFDTQAAIHLATGLPHRLSVLQLFTHIDATAAHHLSTANWPYLGLLCINSKVSEVPDAQSLDVASVQKLAQAKWPFLQELDLKCNDFDQYTIGHLTQGHWPMLKKLTLDSKCMTEAVCDMLSIVNVSEQLQAMRCETAKPDLAGGFQLKRLSSTIWPLSHDVCVVCK